MIHYKTYNFNNLKSYLLSDGFESIDRKDEEGNIVETVNYSNTIFTLDTETTSYFLKNGKVKMFDKTKDSKYYEDFEKQGLMYIWMMGINEDIIYGRTQEELKECFELIRKQMTAPGVVVRSIFYIHNLSFDFMFILNSLGTDFNVFARKSHKIIQASHNLYPFDFRCSYFLTNQGLGQFCEDYNLKVQKKSGQLDYNVLRTPKTKLTEDELEYCEYDIRCLYEIIKFHKNEYKTIYNIPMTSTGKIRRKVKNLLLRNKKYKKQIKLQQPNNYEEHKLLVDSYIGGYVHSNCLNSNMTLKNVVSYDIASSYPAVLVMEKYPITGFCETKQKLKDIDQEEYSFIVDFTVNNMESLTSNHFISQSKICTDEWLPEGLVIDNGRVVSAKKARFILTDVDLRIFLKAYGGKNFKTKINHLYIAEKQYLNPKLIQFILKLYKEKTQLKDVKGKEATYAQQKAFLNGIYGMMVTNTINDEIQFENGQWAVNKIGKDEINELLKKQKEKAFLAYSVGVWCSSYAKANLWNIILQLGDSCVYSDTDSNKSRTDKGLSIEQTKAIYDAYNEKIDEKIKAVCEYYKELSIEDFSPLDPQGQKRTIGYYEDEGVYDEFKTLGAKKYAYIKKGKKGMRLSGVNRKDGIKAWNTLDEFSDGLLFNYDCANKKECFYNDDQLECVFPDGFVSKYKHGICLKPTTYKLSLTPDYSDFLTDSQGCELLRMM